MSRKDTRNASALRGIAPFIAVLTVLIALAALAQTKGASQTFGKSHAAPIRGSAVPSNAGPLDSGTPLFLPAVEYYDSYFGFHTESVAVGDLNGDGKPDLVVGSRSKGPTGLYGVANVLLGVGDGTFQEKGLYQLANAGLNANVALADVNGDGKLDMLASGCAYKDCHTGVVTVRTGNGDGTFTGGFSVFGTGGMNPSAPAVADFNGDGKLDLVVANCGSGCQTGTGTVGVLLGNGNATFQTAVTYGTGGIGAHQVIVADVNGDGKPDLIIPNTGQTSQNCPYGPGSVGVLLGKGDGTFQPALVYGSGGDFAYSVAVADVNGDGKLDVLVANAYASTSCTVGPLGVLLGNGDGTFQPVILDGTAYGQLALADVNGDGKLDLVTAGTSSDFAEVQLGNGDGTFQAPVFFGTGGHGVEGIAVADVNGDGRPDLMVANLCFNTNPTCSHGSVGVLLNDTGPHSPTTTSLVSNVNPAAVNQQVIYTATVKNQSGGPLTGTIAFKHGTATTTVKLVGGQAVYKVTYSGSGTHPIIATYSGDADNATSSSATLIEYVGLVPTQTVLTTSGSPSHVGQPVTFTAKVKWTYGTVPDGEVVTFFNGTTTIGTGNTAGGVAKFTTSSLTVGTHTIKATYPGDSEFKPSNGKVTQVVQ